VGLTPLDDASLRRDCLTQLSRMSREVGICLDGTPPGSDLGARGEHLRAQRGRGDVGVSRRDQVEGVSNPGPSPGVGGHDELVTMRLDKDGGRYGDRDVAAGLARPPLPMPGGLSGETGVRRAHHPLGSKVDRRPGLSRRR
jgi:hypothetical protein